MKSADRFAPGRSAARMNFLERIPTGWLITGAAFACLVLWAGPGWAQASSGDPVSGLDLFNDTTGQAPVAALTHNCTNCHSSVQERRTHIGGSAFADISFDTAMSRFGAAIAANRGGQMGQYSRLDPQQIRDIAAYIADVPRLTSADLTGTTLPFIATAVGNAVTKTITVRHSEATSSNLTITNVTLSGGTAFTRTASCLGAVRAPSGTCTFSVTYTPTTTAAENRTLTVALQQDSTTFTRAITLNGSVQGVVTPPPSGGGGGDDSGGGGLGLLWLSGLALATAALARRRA
jgi:mono/diheme cytochrome c family protein